MLENSSLTLWKTKQTCSTLHEKRKKTEKDKKSSSEARQKFVSKVILKNSVIMTVVSIRKFKEQNNCIHIKIALELTTFKKNTKNQNLKQRKQRYKGVRRTTINNIILLWAKCQVLDPQKKVSRHHTEFPQHSANLHRSHQPLDSSISLILGTAVLGIK